MSANVHSHEIRRRKKKEKKREEEFHLVREKSI